MHYPQAVSTLSDSEILKYRDLLVFVQREDLRQRLLKSMKRRIRLVRSFTGDGTLGSPDLEGLASTSIKFGYFRALLNRFSKERGLDRAWWSRERRNAGVRWDTRVEDFAIILRTHPEFLNYIPNPPLTEDEVLEAAQVEFRDQIAGPGSLYHERMSITNAFTKRVRTRSGRTKRVPKVDANAIDFGRQKETFNEFAFLGRTENDDDVLGRSITRAVSIATREYGWRAGQFWIAHLVFFPGRVTELLRALGYDERTLGKKKFEAVRRDLQRKLPRMEQRLMTILRDDPELQDLYEVTFDTVLPDSSSESNVRKEDPQAAVARETCRGELEQYVLRTRARMLKKVEQDPNLAAVMEALRAEEQDRRDVTYVLQRFIECERNHDWRGFRQFLRTWYDLGTEVAQAVGA